jgi:NifU-like protein involved in Fe-S cluster formation
MKYSDIIAQHFESPRNLGAMEDADAIGEAENAVCLDTLRLFLKFDENGSVIRASFQAEGCVPTIACGSFLTETIIGRTVEDLRGLDAEWFESRVGGLPATKKHAAILAIEALQKALEALAEKRP